MFPNKTLAMKEFDLTTQHIPASINFDETDEGLTVTIDTERLRLTSVIENERSFYYTHIYGDAEVMKLFGTGETLSQEETNTYVTTWIERWKSGNPFGSLAIHHKEDDKIVGHVVLGPGGSESRVPSQAVLGYQIAKQHQGRGFASEAVVPVVQQYGYELAKKKYHVNGQPFKTLVATVHPDNPASEKIIQKAGMIYEKDEEEYGHMRRHYRKNYY